MKKKPTIESLLRKKLPKKLTETYLFEIEDAMSAVDANIFPDDMGPNDYQKNVNKVVSRLVKALKTDKKASNANVGIILAAVGLTILSSDFTVNGERKKD